MPMLTILDDKIKMPRKPKNLSAPEFTLKLSIDAPDMPQDQLKKYKAEFDKRFKKAYSDMKTGPDGFVTKLDKGLEHLDKKIRERLKEIDEINGILGDRKKIHKLKKDGELEKKIARVTKLANQDKEVVDSYGPTLRNAVATFESQVRAKAEEIQAQIEKEWEKKSAGQRSKAKKAARRNTAIKIGIVVGVVLLGAAVAVAVLATGGAALAPVALGLGILAAVVGTASGIATGVKEYNRIKNSLKTEMGKLEEHITRFDKAFAAYSESMGAESGGIKIDLKSKTKGKSEANRKAAMASITKVEKHAMRVAALSLESRTNVRDDRKTLAEMRASAEKAKADFQKAKAALKDMNLKNAHEETNENILKSVAHHEAALKRVDEQAQEVASLLDRFQDLKSALKQGKSMAEVSSAKKRFVRFVYFIPDLLGYLNTASSSASGVSSAATA